MAEQPIRAPSGGPFGRRKQLEDAQRQQPLPEQRELPVEGAAQFSPQVTPLNAPTERPDERISTPPAPETMQPPAPQHDPDMILLAPLLPILEQIVSQPDSSVATRNFYRRLRARLPTEFNMESLVLEPPRQEETDAQPLEQ